MSSPGGSGGAIVAQGQYATAIVDGGLAVSAGMTPRRDGVLAIAGLVGDEVSIDDAKQAAYLAATNALAAIASAAAGAGHIRRCLRLTVYIACTPDFGMHSTVADGASQALIDALGDNGIVARTAVGVMCLPSRAPVEVDLLARIE